MDGWVDRRTDGWMGGWMTKAMGFNQADRDCHPSRFIFIIILPNYCSPY